VLPVILKYHCKHYNLAWVDENANMGLNVLRMMLQFANFCTVTILDPYVPNEKEIEDPILFANNVRTAMADALEIGTTDHSYDDVWFSFNAIKGKVSQDFEIGQVKKMYDLDLDALKVLLRRFKEFDKDNSGTLSKGEFEHALQLEGRQSASIDRLFSFFDTDNSGNVSYREFIQALALLSGRCSSLSQAKLAFLIYDVDGTGRVQVQLLRDALEKSVAHTAISGEQPPSKLLASAPASGDLSFDEFWKLIEKEPELLETTLQLARERVGLSFEESVEQAAEEKARRDQERAKKAQGKKEK